MPKLSLLAGYKEKQRQADLKKKYAIHDERVVVEEKSAAAQIWRATLSAVFVALRLTAQILLIALALIGLCACLYPSLRHELLFLLSDWLYQIRAFLNA